MSYLLRGSDGIIRGKVSDIIASRMYTEMLGTWSTSARNDVSFPKYTFSATSSVSEGVGNLLMYIYKGDMLELEVTI